MGQDPEDYDKLTKGWEKIMTKTCGECQRVFDLFDETDAEEWEYGHDCEVT